ncbi:MAG: hypothetical protein HQM06_17225, partial [Magnetococcales bacterium]|nr:hypothetical protein [Magnetococcales bacterium]
MANSIPPGAPDFQNELDQLTVLQHAGVTDLSAKEHAGIQAELMSSFDPAAVPANVHLKRESTMGDLQIGGESGHESAPLELPSVALLDDLQTAPVGAGQRDWMEPVPVGKIDDAPGNTIDVAEVTPLPNEDVAAPGRSEMSKAGSDMAEGNLLPPTDEQTTTLLSITDTPSKPVENSATTGVPYTTDTPAIIDTPLTKSIPVSSAGEPSDEPVVAEPTAVKPPADGPSGEPSVADGGTFGEPSAVEPSTVEPLAGGTSGEATVVDPPAGGSAGEPSVA